MLEIAKEKTEDGSLDLIRIKGHLDTHTAQDIEIFFKELYPIGNGCFILEASRLETISSTGISALAIIVEETYSREGWVAFLSLPMEIELLFTFIGFTEQVPTFLHQKDALAFFNKIKPKFKKYQIGHDQKNVAQQEEASEKRTNFDSSVEISCSYCGLSLRVSKVGQHMCPGCGQQFMSQLKK